MREFDEFGKPTPEYIAYTSDIMMPFITMVQSVVDKAIQDGINPVAIKHSLDMYTGIAFLNVAQSITKREAEKEEFEKLKKKYGTDKESV